MRSVLAYTASRLLLFAIAYGIVLLLGGRSLFAIVLAFLASGVASYFVLSAQRDAMSAAVAAGIERMRGVGSRLEAGAAYEDTEARDGAEARGDGEARGEGLGQGDGGAADDVSTDPAGAEDAPQDRNGSAKVPAADPEATASDDDLGPDGERRPGVQHSAGQH